MSKERKKQDWMLRKQEEIDGLDAPEWEGYESGWCICYAYEQDQCNCGALSYECREHFGRNRYSYSTTGYGVFSLMGLDYSAGRIEVYDDTSANGYAISEGSYWVPLGKEEVVRRMVEKLDGELPVYINLGSFESCQKAVSEKHNVPIDKFRDKKIIKKVYDKRKERNE